MTLRRHILAAACRAVPVAMVLAPVTVASAQQVSAPATLQMFEARWQTLENRAADAFIAGYGAVWTPPPGLAETGGYSVGYDQYDRFDLGSPERQTLYGTERGLRSAIDTWHRAGNSVYADLVWNHNGFADLGTTDFLKSGGYPGFVLTRHDAIDGDFHSGYAGGDRDGRTSGLIDIDHGTNWRYIRNPVDENDSRNLPAGEPSLYGKIANTPDADNRRFYPSHNAGYRDLYDPATGQSFRVYDFRGDGSEIYDGTPVEENALGYLMRNAQWYVQDVGFDGFRLDATKHMEPWVLNYLDRAVYKANPRKLLDGSTPDVFSFGETLDAKMDLLQSYVRKDINNLPAGHVGGNRDALDFPLHFALKNNLSGNGYANDWANVVNASFDIHDDGEANNGSQGVAFDASHDDGGAYLGNVSNAFLSMRPGNWVVYHNAQEFGNGRDFPKDGRGDALGGMYGDRITTLVGIRNTHGRGDYNNLLVEQNELVYERQGSALVVLSNRLDDGYDERTVSTSFAGGTPLIELTGNAAADGNIPELIVVNGDGTANLRVRRNGSHGDGYLIYGLATPQGSLSIDGASGLLEGGTPTPETNGSTRLADLHVITDDSFDVRLNTQQVNLLGFYRDVDADGDNAVIRINEGLDLNGNGYVDYVTPGSVVYGFEQFGTKSSPLLHGGDGEFVQEIDTTSLPEGMNFVEVRAFRRRNDGGPAVYSSFKEVLYVDRLAPESDLYSVDEVNGMPSTFRRFVVESTDGTADSVHTFLNLPANLSDEQILAMVDGNNRAGKYDRGLFDYGYGNLVGGNHVLTVVTYEITGNRSVKRIGGIGLDTGYGLGVGDLNHDGILGVTDVYGASAFEEVLYSQNAQFNPAADVDANGLVDNRDLWLLRDVYESIGADEAAREARIAELRRGNVNRDSYTDAGDIDHLFAHFGSTDWQLDLDVDGSAGAGDVSLLVERVFETVFGDADLDGDVDRSDFNTLAANWQTNIGWAGADFTGDVFVNESDFALLSDNWGFGVEGGLFGTPELVEGRPTLVPEPGFLSLLAVSGLLLTRPSRRRRRNESLDSVLPTLPFLSPSRTRGEI